MESQVNRAWMIVYHVTQEKLVKHLDCPHHQMTVWLGGSVSEVPGQDSQQTLDPTMYHTHNVSAQLTQLEANVNLENSVPQDLAAQLLVLQVMNKLLETFLNVV